MNKSSIFSLIFLVLVLPGKGEAQQCGSQAGGALCPEGLCCSEWGYCGSTHKYGGEGCQSQCPTSGPPPPPPVPTPPPSDGGDLGGIVTREIFEEMLLHRNNAACPARGFYTYDAFLAAATEFPEFASAGNNTTRKREVAAFFGQTSHETTDTPTEVGATNPYCVPNDRWPCVPGKKYYGRGPIQLSYNYNYGQAGEALGLDLLSNPELVETDPLISFKTAMWFWMTPQPPKPSCHDVVTRLWTPSSADVAAGRVPGYGMTTNIINGGLECGGQGPDPRVESRIGFYKRYCDIFEIDYWINLNCYNQGPFKHGQFWSIM